MYEVNEVKEKGKFVGFGVFRDGNSEPFQIYRVDAVKAAESPRQAAREISIAHHLALLACHDFENAIE